MRVLLKRLADLREDPHPAVSGMELKDSKRKYARMPKATRPKHSKLLARSTLGQPSLDNRSPGETAARGESLIARLEAYYLGTSDPWNRERDSGQARVAERDIKVKKSIAKNAKRARGDREVEFPYNDETQARAMLWRKTTVTT